ncbi:hypothetical protein BDV11DRAFT_90420 [Aspergillus similis]
MERLVRSLLSFVTSSWRLSRGLRNCCCSKVFQRVSGLWPYLTALDRLRLGLTSRACCDWKVCSSRVCFLVSGLVWYFTALERLTLPVCGHFMLWSWEPLLDDMLQILLWPRTGVLVVMEVVCGLSMKLISGYPDEESDAMTGCIRQFIPR